MTVFNLLDALGMEMTGLFKNYVFSTLEMQGKKLNVYLQSLPPPSGEKPDPRFPFIVVRYTLAEDKDYENSSANVSFIIGVVDSTDDYQGYKDVINIQERIRQHFLLHRTVDRSFILQYPVRRIAVDDFNSETYPMFYGQVDTVWTIPTITSEEAYI